MTAPGEKGLKEKAIGFLVLAAIGGGIYLYTQAKSDARTMAPDLTLAGYAELTPEARLKRVAAAAAGVDAADQAGDFTACMGEFAKTKSAELPFDEVFGWCEIERTSSPAVFAAHFNELDAPDLSMEALTVCQTMVQNRLAAPGSAKFSFVEPVPRGRQRYLVSSHVDAQNIFGALMRARFICEIQHDGGDPLVLANWTTHQLVVE